MSPGHVIDFNLDGSAEAMHNDRFPLAFLGRQEIHRATEIRFIEATQTWSICWPNDEASIPFVDGLCEGFETYDGARSVEVQWLNACRLEGVAWNSPKGQAALKFIRGVTRV